MSEVPAVPVRRRLAAIGTRGQVWPYCRDYPATPFALNTQLK